ncbi:Uncharacterized protein FWK35_00004324 [Aphis craccivora]|uniref:Uncharacterized protein n=1 Tax=Aphis craccivora TaxID=307492 RepID=A0A6G0ZB70_APHCR|nr:Uncharacterized protein FWK35_00004324 [Aphis craccivora]
MPLPTSVTLRMVEWPIGYEHPPYEVASLCRYSITSRKNASISNFGGGFRWQSEYPWCII